ncbi:MAG: hypothetical protein PHI77_02545 [Candidatus Pacebacteria bacterium]|nr:hypothetical protein [Candidatus Paceibacterota bacterium]
MLDFFGGTGKYPLYNEEESRGLTNSADFGSAYLRNREGSEAEYAKKMNLLVFRPGEDSEFKEREEFLIFPNFQIQWAVFLYLV